VNFTRDVVAAAPPDALALIELRRDGGRREWTFAEVGDAAARLAGRLLAEGVEAGDVVMTLVGNRSEWALAMLACFTVALARARGAISHEREAELDPVR